MDWSRYGGQSILYTCLVYYSWCVCVCVCVCVAHVRVWCGCVREENDEWVIEEKLEGHNDWVRDVAWCPSIGLPISRIASCSQVCVCVRGCVCM